jgi:hypothetical protein
MTSLVAVRAALKISDSQHATTFRSLMDTGRLVPYKSKEKARQKLGSKAVDYPTLGKKQTPSGLRKPHSDKKLQEMCLRDLPEAREYFGDRLLYFAHSGDADSSVRPSDDVAGLQTINSLTDVELAATGTIVTFPSETLETLLIQDWEAPANLLRASMATCTVLPNNTLLPIHHSNESTTITTLLSGSIVWIIWPPTDHNLRTLQTAYEHSAEDLDESKLTIADSLEGGTIFVQTEGDGLRLPPFSLMTGLATTTSVLATYSHVTVENFISMLQKLPLLKAWFHTEVEGGRKQTEFNASVLLYLDLMLNGDPDNEERDNIKLPTNKSVLLDTLLSVWDNIKDDLAAMMGPADRKTMENIWGEFLTMAVGRECRLCGKRFPKNARRKHFIGSHWPKAKDAERNDSMEALEGDIDGSRVTTGGEEDDGVNREDEGAMELDE